MSSSSSNSKSTTFASSNRSGRPQRKAATKFLDKLQHYRKAHDDYIAAYRRYAHEKKTNQQAKAPIKPRIPTEFYQHLTGHGDDETSDEEFHDDGVTEDESDDFADDDDEHDE